jgi:DnaK suppressor protein
MGVRYIVSSPESQMDRRELDRYKRALLEKRGQLSVENADAGSPVPAAGGWEGDPVDQANADAEADLQIRLHQSSGRLLRAVDGALHRIRQGSFGICQICQKPISRARLEAVPWTRHCRDCKEREHAA